MRVKVGDVGFDSGETIPIIWVYYGFIDGIINTCQSEADKLVFIKYHVQVYGLGCKEHVTDTCNNWNSLETDTTFFIKNTSPKFHWF